MYQTGCNIYRKSAANTIEDKRVILLKLYEGALVFIDYAQRGIMDNSARIRGENISKVMNIINELECALDHERGGELAARLSSLYKYSTDRLLFASSHNDMEALEQVKRIVTLLKEGFETAYKEQKRAAAPSNVMPAAISTPPGGQKAVQFAV